MIAFLRRRPPSLLLRLLVLAVIALGLAPPVAHWPRRWASCMR